jgi:hypothetical protein
MSCATGLRGRIRSTPGLFGKRAMRMSLAIIMLNNCFAQAQSPSAETASGQEIGGVLRELQAEVRELRQAVSELRAESERYRVETERLRREVEAAQSLAGEGQSAQPSGESSSSQRLARLEEEHGLLQEKVNQQYQTKVESASKYRVRLSGIVLLNAFNNQGAVDSIDVPTFATSRTPQASGGSVGATLRQTQLGLEGFGPTLAGARSIADLQLDFGGGVPDISNGVTSGLLRVRTATARLDWERTSLVVGQDALFLAPQSPTSFASLIVPALSYSGNLWGWIPQIRIERRFDLTAQSGLTLQGGVLDPLTGELPVTEYERQPTAGENSRKPGVGARAAWSQRAFGRDFVLGVAGYYSKQNWGFHRDVNGWAGMTDWQIPFASWLKLTGDFYRGSAIGAFGAGTGRSVLFNGLLSDPATSVRALNSMGGWTQLKVIPAPKIEFNTAVGQDNPFAQDVRFFGNAQSYLNPYLTRNRAGLINVIYRPRSDLLLSAEFRRLRTFEINNSSQAANHMNLAMGFLF